MGIASVHFDDFVLKLLQILISNLQMCLSLSSLESSFSWHISILIINFNVWLLTRVF